jgi:hypothetical protein
MLSVYQTEQIKQYFLDNIARMAYIHDMIIFAVLFIGLILYGLLGLFLFRNDHGIANNLREIQGKKQLSLLAP